MIKVDHTLDATRFVGVEKERLRALVIESVQDLNEEIVQNTPVKTGHLRRSWYASINAPVVKPGSLGEGDKTGAQEIARAAITVQGVQLGDTYYFVNGAAYAAHVEYGTANMLPRLYVQRAVDRFDVIVADAAARIGVL